jgi:hypothetical protein
MPSLFSARETRLRNRLVSDIIRSAFESAVHATFCLQSLQHTAGQCRSLDLGHLRKELVQLVTDEVDIDVVFIDGCLIIAQTPGARRKRRKSLRRLLTPQASAPASSTPTAATARGARLSIQTPPCCLASPGSIACMRTGHCFFCDGLCPDLRVLRRIAFSISELARPREM